MKCLAPCSASWRGQPVEIADDGSCEISPLALAELRPHGFREWTEADEKRARKTLTLAKSRGSE